MSYQDPHWLKEKYKDVSIEDLLEQMKVAYIFDHPDKVVIKAEIERREKENGRAD